ncbi:carbohydrate-binding module family 43 protein [Patellaria atrata CBS 101060]|uniref:1,3-beta-glucanosyltransferase n=1 Tax=Patellaria atrata CBS 101060 TaxID=1346257 RepID=A0A9P4S677_9PEZI|nr:carbohydrate-binding module family 43 protein [Patellaria atrata CBS 101060]
MKTFSTFAAAAAIFATANAAVDHIVIKGSKFFYEGNGTQFFMNGVAYQQDVSTNGTLSGNDEYTDPLADPSVCRRDIPFLVQLRTNTIRVYALDPEKNHDDCMNQLADAGIYVIADLSQPGQSINRDDASWTDDLFERYTSVVDMMAKYDNTLGFFAGNEVSNQANNTVASAFVKAAVRDTKAYIKRQRYRPLGVGYATNDDKDIREDLAAYFNCGDPDDAIDFWGYNIYSWCGRSSFQRSGFDVRTREFASYSVPVFFAEYGCNEVQPRLFTEVGALYGDEMTDVWSGGIVYMYFQETNDFGLVEVNNNRVSTLADFDNLSSQMARIDPTGVNMADYNPTNTQPADCPAVNRGWRAQATPLPPVANKELCECMVNSASCVPADDLDEDDYGDLFGTVCGLEDGICAGIEHNATTGSYGAYSMCNPKQQLAFALNAYFQSQNRRQDACDFRGQAKTQRSSDASGNCERLMDQAGEDGTGTVTSAPTGTGAAAGSATSSGAAVGAVTVPRMETGLMQLGLYVVVAMFSGAGMLLL